ncbi:tRNA pseudouridine(38-40) synthase [Kwoniella bestiolae CBS 10118]|uniref:tRNA pseudouridine synthase 1 n=1 Tax=Kwoniella bestiolae CBS 10118 TaxID=1296100 RepID=A0A1B9FZC8_9TREE|nr:tRNA pseudouridine(38-40) synthase [Kwoniella bestiolae CBS 10118]OCF24126.1 tRNA pseudouridine(38-40) synthase [Kwoniella bestiolae CBS 10118]
MEAPESAKRPRSPSPIPNIEIKDEVSVNPADAEGQPPAKKPHVESTTSAPSDTPISGLGGEVQVDPEEAMFNAMSGENGNDSDKKKKTWGRGQGYGNGGKGKGKEREKKGPDAVRYERRSNDWTPREKKEGEESEARLPKRRCALLVGYCGTGYSGMQIQTHGSRTIEGDVFAALVKAGAISADNANDHRKSDVQRAARTDAGVHAAGNCISLKMIVEPPLPEGYKTLAEYVNTILPDQIRMWGFVRTVKSFNARTAADSRIYEYLLPSYCLLPPGRDDPLGKRLDRSSPGWRDLLGKEAVDFIDAAPKFEPETEEDGGKVINPKNRGEFERRRGWRVDNKTLERFRELIAQYKGTHNFHNFTVGKPFNDRTVKRFMIKLEVKDPKVYGDIEWISVQIHGQSFMLHQIRKMISMAMLACRTASPPSLIPETFGPKRIHVPKAPPLGLLLEAPQFGVYNTRITTKANGLQEDRDPVDFGLYGQLMHDFKVKWIYEKLREEELQSHVFHKWMRQMDCSMSNGLAFLNTQGTIPPEADLSKGAKEARRAAAIAARAAGEGEGEGEGEAEKDIADEEMDSEDEEVDMEELKRGEWEG